MRYAGRNMMQLINTQPYPCRHVISRVWPGLARHLNRLALPPFPLPQFQTTPTHAIGL